MVRGTLLPMDMTMWPFRFPAHDHDLWVVRAAYARQFPWTLAELGRDLGVSRSQVSRIVRRLVEEGFLVEEGGSYDFNEGHPLAFELGQWIYLATGARRPISARFYPLRRSAQERLGASRSLPDAWRTLDIAPAHGTPTRSALEARQAAIAIAESRRGLVQLEDLAQEVYSDVKAERARDFIHLLGGLGDDAGLAAWLLRRHAARQDIARQQSPLEPVVYDVEWERVGFLLDAQASVYESAADLVASAYAAGREAHRNRQQIVDEMATYPNYNADVQASVLDEATRRAAQVQDLRETALQQKLFWHGGMPGFHEVGTLGDLLVKHELLRARDSIREVQKRYTFPSDAVSGEAE